MRWTAPGRFNDFNGLRVRDRQVFATQSFPATETDVFDLDGTQRCSGTPTVCTPLRRLPATLSANLVFGVYQPVGFGTRQYHVLAYDTKLAAGCSGSPKLCAPVADIPMPGMEGTPEPLVIAGGRVYMSGTDDHKVHVLALPGDVS